METGLQFLEWDSDFFKKKIGKIAFQNEQNLQKEIIKSKSENYDLIYLTSNEEINNWHEIKEDFEINFVDKKTTFLKEIEFNISEHEFISLYSEQIAEEKLIKLAIQSGIYSRFNVDKKIGKENFENLYQTWIEKSVSLEIALGVLAYRIDNELVGFTSMGKKNNRADIGIIAVDEAYRGKGIGKSLIKSAEKWFAQNGFKTMQVLTQGDNHAACNLYKNCGFEIEKVEFFYHLWRKD
jgi:dTDP-4-amino-4,6-dideoxy-D-galactose acyltransferase